MRFWGADSDRDYLDAIHEHDEPKVTETEQEPPIRTFEDQLGAQCEVIEREREALRIKHGRR